MRMSCNDCRDRSRIWRRDSDRAERWRARRRPLKKCLLLRRRGVHRTEANRSSRSRRSNRAIRRNAALEDWSMNGRRFATFNMNLKYLIQWAWSLQAKQVVGGPPWMDDARFDITGEIDGDGVPNQHQWKICRAEAPDRTIPNSVPSRKARDAGVRAGDRQRRAQTQAG